MLLKNLVKIIFVIASVAAENLPEYTKCIGLTGESGFFEVLERPAIKEKSTISLEVKANNCDVISLSFSNGDDYSLTVQNIVFPEIGPIHKFDLFAVCNGLWHNGTRFKFNLNISMF